MAVFTKCFSTYHKVQLISLWLDYLFRINSILNSNQYKIHINQTLAQICYSIFFVNRKRTFKRHVTLILRVLWMSQYVFEIVMTEIIKQSITGIWMKPLQTTYTHYQTSLFFSMKSVQTNLNRLKFRNRNFSSFSAQDGGRW